MNKPLIVVAMGTRPEVIKLAPVVQALARAEDLRVRVCATAQHRQMLDRMMRSFGLKADDDLDLMQPDQSLPDLTGRALVRMSAALRAARPDYVLVQGDTTTAFAAALAAFYERIPVGHVEAGLRSRDLANPFPEEANRALVARLCDLHFAPTASARRNLLGEGVARSAIVNTGNTVVDALRWCCGRPHDFQEPGLRAALAGLGPGHKPVLVTTHRRENFGEPLEALCRAFTALVERHPDVQLFYPVHLNPRVQEVVRARARHPRVHLLPTLDYFDLVHLMRRSAFVLTDSGGLQEEAPSLGKPVVVLRRVTERPEAVDAGVAELAGTDEAEVLRCCSRLLEDPAHYAAMSRGCGLYGDGRASERIVETLRHRFGLAKRRPSEFRPALARAEEGPVIGSSK